MEHTKIELFSVNATKYFIAEWSENKDRILNMIPPKNNADDHIKFTDFMCSENNEYKEEVISILDLYLKDFYKKCFYKFRTISSMWCQRYDARDYFVPHDHGSIGYSCVLYAKMNQEHKSTLFFSPFNDETGSHPCYSAPVKEGDLLIFPANIMHTALPHNSKEERVIIAFNLV